MIIAIETGGTKIEVAAFETNDLKNIVAQATFDTLTPLQSLPQVVAFMKQFNVSQIGLATFGPVDLNTNSATYGYILQTPKEEWAHFNLISYFKEHFNVPIYLSTDVNTAALAEALHHDNQSKHCVLYLTIGTGIGGGLVINKEIINGATHFEMGHISLKIHPNDHFSGNCIFHHNCLEGLCSGPALYKRTGVLAQDLDLSSPDWNFFAYYLAQALANFTLCFGPDLIVLGGGVMKKPGLIELVRKQYPSFINGYLDDWRMHNLEEFIVLPKLHPLSGLYGAAMLGAKQ
ncbi:MAG: ROK family protein [Bacilli bacterium]